MKIFLLITGCLVVLLLLYSFLKASLFRSSSKVEDSNKVMILTDQNFTRKIIKGYTLVYIWAPWCLSCRLLAAIMNELAEDQNIDATIAKLNVDENKKNILDYNINDIPMSILFKNGKEYKRFIGVKPIYFFKAQIKNAKLYFESFIVL